MLGFQYEGDRNVGGEEEEEDKISRPGKDGCHGVVVM